MHAPSPKQVPKERLRIYEFFPSLERGNQVAFYVWALTCKSTGINVCPRDMEIEKWNFVIFSLAYVMLSQLVPHEWSLPLTLTIILTLIVTLVLERARRAMRAAVTPLTGKSMQRWVSAVKAQRNSISVANLEPLLSPLLRAAVLFFELRSKQQKARTEQSHEISTRLHAYHS